MRFIALATDYDGTIADEGRVDDATRRALERLARAGFSLVLVTGRRLDDLQRVFDGLDMFGRVVAENGAVVFRPRDGVIRCLADPPPPALVEALRARGVDDLSLGRVIAATWERHECAVRETIAELRAPVHVELNKGAVMVLPEGVTKATGLAAAAEDLALPVDAFVGVGDGENDAALLEACGYAVAPDNALASLKARADLVTAGAAGAGFVELVERMLAGDLPPRRQARVR